MNIPAAGVIAAMLASAAAAEDSPARIPGPQAPTPASESVAADQIGAQTSTAMTQQVGQPHNARDAPVGPQQMHTERRRLGEPPPLSRTSQGRNVRADPVSGRDRCDPAKFSGLSEDERTRCSTILEQRAGDFELPERPEPSPEERLLGFQSRNADSTDADAAARTLARGEVEDSLAAQAAAVAVAGPPAEDPEADIKPQDLSPAARALIETVPPGGQAALGDPQ